MNKATIEDIAYLLEQAQKNNQPKPIVFLGAGASKSGGIPLAGGIVKDILAKYPDNPKVKKLLEADRTYPKLMGCLLPAERKELLKEYIDKAKVNVTHIYLAQLITQGYIDYVLTVNFDNLMLRALALYNYFPPTYDLAILKDLTTTSFPEKSVLYLHGQHHGLWLLNTEEEMAKVEKIVPPILNKITNNRAWIVIGYSGDDPIFNHIVNLGCFDNGMFWVGYNDNLPNDIVCNNLLEKPNTSATLVSGYDADAFILALSGKLNDLPQPVIFDKPFSFLKDAIENIVDIDDTEHFKDVKERLEIVKNQVDESISQFEKGIIKDDQILKEKIKIDQIKKEIINKIIAEDYSNIDELTAKVNEINEIQLKISLSGLYNNWGITIFNLAKTKQGIEQEQLFKESFEKYAKAIELNPKDDTHYYNWGITIFNLAKTKQGIEQEQLFKEGFEKYAKATEINPNKDNTYYDWGLGIFNLATTKQGIEQEQLFKESFEKYAKATEINPNKDIAYTNWGIAIFNLAKTKQGIEQEQLLKESFEKYAKATEINPKNDTAYYNWGLAIFNLAKTKQGIEQEQLLKESFEKYAKATEINPNKDIAYTNWGLAIFNLAKTKQGIEQEQLLKESFEKYAKATEINPNKDNTYYNWGNTIAALARTKQGKEQEQFYQEAEERLLLAQKLGGNIYNLACIKALRGKESEALELLEVALSKNEVEANFVLEDEDWKGYKDDNDFKKIIDRYMKEQPSL